MITYVAPVWFLGKTEQNDLVISKNESQGKYATLIVFKELKTFKKLSTSPDFRNRDMKSSMEAVLVSLLDFLLFLWKTTQIWACVEPLKSLSLHMLSDLLSSKRSHQLSLHCMYCREWARRSPAEGCCLSGCHKLKLKVDYFSGFKAHRAFCPVQKKNMTRQMGAKMDLGGKGRCEYQGRQEGRQESQTRQKEKMWSMIKKQGWVSSMTNQTGSSQQRGTAQRRAVPVWFLSMSWRSDSWEPNRFYLLE